mmetsp:Transcript_15072/g.45189  ORF Transcript_15072/g.45189 Transcript_15072/m.45189 type:complete len:615 (-) Transcript_15072:396-2240(-)
MWLFRKKKSAVKECLGTEDELAPSTAYKGKAASGPTAAAAGPVAAEAPLCPRDALATAAPPPPDVAPPPVSPIKRPIPTSATPSPKAPSGSAKPSPKAPAWPLSGSDLATTTSSPSQDVPPSPSIAAMTPKSARSLALQDEEEIVRIPEPVNFKIANPSAPLAPPPADRQQAPGELSFDAPLEQIYAALSQAFGPMVSSHLQSHKWDKRAQALKEVGSVLKGMGDWQKPGSTRVIGKSLSPHESAKRWRISCQLLHHVMRDKVMPVRMVAMDLFVDVMGLEECAPRPEVDLALGVLLDHVSVTLGDSNVRLHEAARKCVLFCAERGVPGLVAMLKTLRDRLEAVAKSRDKTKVYFGVLDTVIILLQHFPGRRAGDREEADEEDEESWTEADVLPFVVAGLDDTLGTRVRGRAVALAVTVFQTLGAEAVQPMLDGLRPAKQQLLKQKFQEAEEGGLDMPVDGGDRAASALMGSGQLDGLMVCGSGMKPGGHAHEGQDLLPGSVHAEFEEEFMMDNILEEVGMVFGGSGIMNDEIAGPFYGMPADYQRGGLGLPDALEEELLQMGLGMDMLDMDMLEEQQALLCSIQESMEPHPTAWVEGDLSVADLDADLLIQAC